MRNLALLSALGLALLVPAASQAAEPDPNQAVQMPSKDANKLSNAVTRLCFTCGGFTPFRRLVINLNGTGNRVLEYGSGCGGGLVYRFDNNPYLCSDR